MDQEPELLFSGILPQSQGESLMRKQKTLGCWVERGSDVATLSIGEADDVTSEPSQKAALPPPGPFQSH